MKKIYLAIPYSHQDPKVREERFELVNKMAARLIEEGYNVLSPISHSHPISLDMDNSNKSEFWCNLSLEWLVYCDEMHVCCIDGWKESKGVKREIEFAKENNIPIIYLDME